MSAPAEVEDEVFDTGASPVLRSPELRRSTRTSARKRSSTGSIPYPRPKNKKKMSTANSPGAGTPVPTAAGQSPVDAGNPFSSLHGQTSGGPNDMLVRMQEMMGGMLGGMESRLSKATDSLRTSVSDQIGQVMTSVTDLSSRVSVTEKRMDNMEEIVEKKIEEGIRKLNLPAASRGSVLEHEFPLLNDNPMADNASVPESSTFSSSYATALATGLSVRSSPTIDRREREYWSARRALRIRPIPEGVDESEGSLCFFRDKLRLDEATIKCLGEMRFERMPHGPKSKYRREILIRFNSVEARDVVRSAASNLAGQGPDVGIRLEVPNSLKGAMKALQTLSYDIRMKHPSSRRNILFDDESMDLVLDFSLGQGKPWKRIGSDHAKKRSKKTAATGLGFRIDGEELEEMLANETPAE